MKLNMHFSFQPVCVVVDIQGHIQWLIQRKLSQWKRKWFRLPAPVAAVERDDCHKTTLLAHRSECTSSMSTTPTHLAYWISAMRCYSRFCWTAIVSHCMHWPSKICEWSTISRLLDRETTFFFRFFSSQNMSSLCKSRPRSSPVENIRFCEEKNAGQRDQTFVEIRDERDNRIQGARNGVKASGRQTQKQYFDGNHIESTESQMSRTGNDWGVWGLPEFRTGSFSIIFTMNIEQTNPICIRFRYKFRNSLPNWSV